MLTSFSSVLVVGLPSQSAESAPFCLSAVCLFPLRIPGIPEGGAGTGPGNMVVLPAPVSEHRKPLASRTHAASACDPVLEAGQGALDALVALARMFVAQVLVGPGHFHPSSYSGIDAASR